MIPSLMLILMFHIQLKLEKLIMRSMGSLGVVAQNLFFVTPLVRLVCFLKNNCYFEKLFLRK
jgi:hypothetical protein